MKKLFAVMVGVAAFAACTDNPKTEETRSASRKDSAVITAPAPDTATPNSDTSATKTMNAPKP